MEAKVDQTALKVNQASIIVLLVLAFLLNWIWLVAFVAAVMLVGTFCPRLGCSSGFMPGGSAPPAC